MTDKPLNIYQRVNKIMGEVTVIRKEDKKVNGQYTYAGHNEVSRVMHAALQRNGVVIEPTVTSLKQDGNRTEVMMNIPFVNMDEPSDRFSVDYPGYGIDSQDKGIGKAISYAVKTALLKVFCLETSDDDVEKDNIDHKPVNKISKNKKIELSQAAYLDALIKTTAEKFTSEEMDKIREVYKGFGVKSHSELDISQYNCIIDLIRETDSSRKAA